MKTFLKQVAVSCSVGLPFQVALQAGAGVHSPGATYGLGTATTLGALWLMYKFDQRRARAGKAATFGF